MAPAQPPGRPPQYPPGKCQLQLSRSVVAAGESVGVAGGGFAPGAQVKLSAAGVSLGTVTADTAGSFATDVVIPASVKPGAHQLSAAGSIGGGETQVLSASLTVTASGGRSSDSAGLGGALPRTGGGDGIVPLAALATALLAVGTSAVVGARRRSTRRA